MLTVKRTGYIAWLSSHTSKTMSLRKTIPHLREHIILRSAQIIFIFILAESSALFAFWNESGTFFADNDSTILSFASVVFVISVIQFVVSYRIDIDSVNNHRNQEVSEAPRICSENISKKSKSKL